MKRLFLAVFLLFFFSGRYSVLAQSPSLPSSVAAQVDKVFDKWDKPTSPGCSLGVYKDSQILYKHGYGMADLNEDVLITPATVFHVASMSKQFSAASMVLLAQQGKLALDDDVRKYLPELPDFGQRITIRHLIHHTSGLRDQWALLGLAGWRYSQDLITDDDVMSVITRQKDLNFKPGDKHVYCNTGYTLLGLIVKRVTGLSLREFTTKNIFEPLGMTHTHFRDDHAEIIKHNAIGYEQEGAGPGKGPGNENDKPFRISITNFDTTGATSLHTTVEDLLLWDENFYHPRVGGPAFLQQMLERGKLNNGETLDYASGLVHGKYKGLPTVDHGGADAGYRSDLTRFPDQHFSAAVLCNFAETNPSDLVRKVADVLLARDFKADSASPSAKPGESATHAAITLTAVQHEALSGLYWNRDADEFTRVSSNNDQLIIDSGSDDPLKLQPFDERHFHVANRPWGSLIDFHFLPASAGQPRRIEQSFSGGGKPDIFESTEPFTPDAADLAQYAGAYVSEEIDPI